MVSTYSVGEATLIACKAKPVAFETISMVLKTTVPVCKTTPFVFGAYTFVCEAMSVVYKAKAVAS